MRSKGRHWEARKKELAIILLPLLLEFWDYRHELSHRVYLIQGKEPWALHVRHVLQYFFLLFFSLFYFLKQGFPI